MYFTQAVTEHDNTTTIEPISTRELQERTLQVSNFASKNALIVFALGLCGHLIK